MAVARILDGMRGFPFYHGLGFFSDEVLVGLKIVFKRANSKWGGS